MEPLKSYYNHNKRVVTFSAITLSGSHYTYV